MNKRIYYAIGDVHGYDDMLGLLHDEIFKELDSEAETTIIHLGDYVDRGSKSKQVIDRIIKLQSEAEAFGPPTLKIINLLGNHEDMLIKAAEASNYDPIWLWEQNGGDKTLQSYGVDAAKNILKDHLKYLKTLSFQYRVEKDKLLFVHAGIEPSVFPNLEKETAIWIRSHRFFNDYKWDNPKLQDWLVVHGHSPINETGEYSPRRINVDTGVCFGGRLSAVKITVENDDVRSRNYRLIQIDQKLNVLRF